MRFAVLAYNFPHWKTQNGLINLVCNGFTPEIVILQDRKELTHPHSKYRITPKDEYLINPKELCNKLNLRSYISDHDEFYKFFNNTCDFAVILGARILKYETIHRYPKGILNIHPGILPGNRGLDNLKWSLIKGLPIGVTAHFIDSKIDMGYVVKTEELTREGDESIRDVYIRQRNLEQKVLINTMKQFQSEGINYANYEKVAKSEKFSAVPDELDRHFSFTEQIAA